MNPPHDPEHQAELDALEAHFQALADAGAKSVLTPKQAAHWQHKVESSIEGMHAKPKPPITFWTNTRNIFRVRDHEYSFLDHTTGKWVQSASVCDSVTGHRGACDTNEITLDEAKTLAKSLTRRKVEWL